MEKRPLRRTLYTIGHSTRSVGEFIDVLRAFRVTRLVDIRSIPRSRTNPQFNQDVLPEILLGAEIEYVHLAKLGGLRVKSRSVEENLNAGWTHRAFHNYADYAQTAQFRTGLHELLRIASAETCAIMCAEAVWWRCHRRIVTDHLLAHGVPVVHLFTTAKGEPASLTPFAVIGERDSVTYPAVEGPRSASHASLGQAAGACLIGYRQGARGKKKHLSNNHVEGGISSF